MHSEQNFQDKLFYSKTTTSEAVDEPTPTNKVSNRFFAQNLTNFKHRYGINDNQLANWLGVNQLQLFKLAICPLPGTTENSYYQEDLEILVATFKIEWAKLEQIVKATSYN